MLLAHLPLAAWLLLPHASLLLPPREQNCPLKPLGKAAIFSKAPK